MSGWVFWRTHDSLRGSNWRTQHAFALRTRWRAGRRQTSGFAQCACDPWPTDTLLVSARNVFLPCICDDERCLFVLSSFFFFLSFSCSGTVLSPRFCASCGVRVSSTLQLGLFSAVRDAGAAARLAPPAPQGASEQASSSALPESDSDNSFFCRPCNKPAKRFCTSCKMLMPAMSWRPTVTQNVILVGVLLKAVLTSCRSTSSTHNARLSARPAS